MTPEEIEQVSRHFDIPKTNCFLIENGVDIDELNRLANRQLNWDAPELLHDSSVFKIVSVGRLENVKNHKFIIKALSLLDLKSLNIHFFLIGSGGKKKYLEELTGQLEIEDHVHFLGWQSNPFHLMKQCHLFILSSKWEGFPNILLEAMAIGMPVISTQSSQSVAVLLEHGKKGKLVDNPKELASQISFFVHNRHQLADISEKSKERAKNFTIEKMILNYAKMIKKVTQNDIQ